MKPVVRLPHASEPTRNRALTAKAEIVLHPLPEAVYGFTHWRLGLLVLFITQKSFSHITRFR
ncbi:MAG TPA: hypothetical protein VK335_21935 [Bryobacteraceae bacterium]|nr:hypothetical protein [Bryobacteraceae bacterium]